VIFEFFSYVNYSQGAVINSRFAFGMIGNNFIYIIVAILLLSLLLLLHFIRRLDFLPLVLTGSGVTANLIDRLIYHGTVDYFKIFDLPIFNLPDIFIITGLVMTLILLLQKNTLPVH